MSDLSDSRCVQLIGKQVEYYFYTVPLQFHHCGTLLVTNYFHFIVLFNQENMESKCFDSKNCFVMPVRVTIFTIKQQRF